MADKGPTSSEHIKEIGKKIYVDLAVLGFVSLLAIPADWKIPIFIVSILVNHGFFLLFGRRK